MTIVLMAAPDDAHAATVQSALADLGIKSALLFLSDFPGSLYLSYNDSLDEVTLSGPANPLSGPMGVVWNRLICPTIRPPRAHPADLHIIERSGRVMVDAYLENAMCAAYQINDFRNAERIESKLRQLQLAKSIGFTLPRTLVSNDPHKIRDFVAMQRTITKAVWPSKWKVGNTQIFQYTVEVAHGDLQDDDSLALCPMIYQECIEKAVEYRAIVFGRRITLVELDSQHCSDARMDWRAAALTDIPLREVECPPGLADMINRFMNAAGLAMGSFDLALDRNGRIIFFEINQQGQFLWVEDMNPAIDVLDRFISFLLECQPQACHDPNRRRLALAHYKYINTTRSLDLRWQGHERIPVAGLVEESV